MSEPSTETCQAMRFDVRVPLVASRARKALLDAGEQITPEALAKVLTKEDLNKLGGCLRTSVQKEGKDAIEKYKACLSDADRRKWIAAFVLDPDASRLVAKFTQTRSLVSGTQGRVLWLTVPQLSGPLFFNNKDHAELAAKGLPSRPHELKSLSDAGVLQYRHEVTEEVWKKFTAQEFKTEATADLTPDDYNKTDAAISTDAPPAPKRSRKNTTPVQLSPASKARHEVVQERNAALKVLKESNATAKRKAETYRKELDVNTRSAESLLTKGFPREMVEFYVSAFTPVSTEASELITLWAEIAAKDSGLMSKEEIDDIRTNVEANTKDLDTRYQELDGNMKQLKKLG